MFVEHPLQVHCERCEALRVPFGCRRQDCRPRVEQPPQARIGTVIMTRLAPFLDHARQRAVRYEASLKRPEDETFRALVGQRQVLETIDPLGLHLLKLAE